MKTRDLFLYKELHEQDLGYGASTAHHFDKIKKFISEQNPKSILDFGCGKGSLENLISKEFNGILIHGYDPAIDSKSKIELPEYEMLLSTDVLEHLYEDEIAPIFEEMISLNPKSMYHLICHRAAYQILPDGTNAHKTIETPEWWFEKITSIVESRGYIVEYENQGHEVGYFKVYLK